MKIGAVLLILMGIMTLTGFMNGITGYLSRISPGGAASVQEETDGQQETEAQGETDGAETGSDAGEASAAAESGEAASSADAADESEEESEREEIPAYDFTLTDQYGNTHTFSDYKGKTVFLNFWATWCPPCKSEMPDIQALYENTGKTKAI